MRAGESWKGTVKWFNSSRGRGYITSDTGLDIIVYNEGIVGTGVKLLQENERVRFEVNEVDGRLTAINVAPLDRG
jgi:CspA family cold shock protein